MGDRIPVVNESAINEPEGRRGDGAHDQGEVRYAYLYESAHKIYTRKVNGFFQRLRRYSVLPFLLGYFLLPWVNLAGRQAVLFDLPARKFHIFAITFYPQDGMLLAWLLIIAAFGLFAVTNFVGRVWCGFSCPQTVWTHLFIGIEQLTEGDRHQRIRLDNAPWTREKILRKTAKHAMWLFLAFGTGFAFVGYFTPIRQLNLDFYTLHADPAAYFWILLFTAATYTNAGWLREQVCKYMCPYARFQSAMFDKDTLIVSYDAKRGEPRGARRKEADVAAAGLGDCVDCTYCVQVCPTDIDIRNGLQYECINCGLCIDACNGVMEKMGYAPGLIKFTTENVLAGKPLRLLRPRLVGYVSAVLVMCILFIYAVATRIPVKLDVIRDRNSLYRMNTRGLVENVYRLEIINMDKHAHVYDIAVEGTVDYQIVGATHIELAAEEVREVPLAVAVDPGLLHATSNTLYFTIRAHDHAKLTRRHEARFLAPTP